MCGCVRVVSDAERVQSEGPSLERIESLDDNVVVFEREVVQRSWCRCGTGMPASPVPLQTWEGVSPVALHVGGGEPSPGADVAAASRALERDVQRTACGLQRLRVAPLVL